MNYGKSRTRILVGLGLILLFSMVLFGCGGSNDRTDNAHYSWQEINCPAYPLYVWSPAVPERRARPCYKYYNSAGGYWYNHYYY